MWNYIVGQLPTGLILFCATLSAIIPWAVYAINAKLHEIGDPPWQQGMDRTPNDMPGNIQQLPSQGNEG